MPTPARNARFDALFVLAAALFALLYFLGRWRGAVPFLDLSGDAARIASFLAAADHPGAFARDPLLGDPGNYSFYFAAIMPVVRGLAGLTGDYGSAFTYLLPVLVFAQIVGFYLLGLELMKDRFGAALLAVATSALDPIWMAGGEGWGLFLDAIPRFTFQAAMPYLLLLALRWRTRPERWPWLMASIGLATYLHTPSGPVFGFAVWCGLLASLPGTWTPSQKARHMVLLAFVFVVCIAPFGVHYFGNIGGDLTPADAEARMAEFRNRTRYYADLGIYHAHFLNAVSRRVPILPLAVVGVVALLRLRADARGVLRFLSAWMLGVVAVSVGVTLADQGVARSLDRLPVLTLFVRSLRYSIPILLLLCIWPIAELRRTREARGSRWGVAGAALALLGLFAYAHPPAMFFQGVSCLLEARGLVCPQPHEAERLAAFDALREQTPPGSTVLALQDDLAVRYYALRPSVFTYRDLFRSSRPGQPGFAEWRERRRSLMAATRQRDRARKVSTLAFYAREWDADYLLLPFRLSRRIEADLAFVGATVVYSNRRYALVDVREDAPTGDVP